MQVQLVDVLENFVCESDNDDDDTYGDLNKMCEFGWLFAIFLFENSW